MGTKFPNILDEGNGINGGSRKYPEYSKVQIDNKMENVFDSSTILENYYCDENGNLVSNSSYFVTDYIPISAFEIISIKYLKEISKDSREGSGARYATFFDDSKSYTEGINLHQDTILNRSILGVTAPNTGYVRFSFQVEMNKSDILIVKQETIPTTFDIDKSEKITKSIELSRLYDKTFLTFGDSIVNGAGNNGVGIGELLANKYNGKNLDYSVGGATIGRTGSLDILSQVAQAQSHYMDADFILFNGMTNDISDSGGNPIVPIGSISSGFDAVLDETTFYGGFETLCKLLLVNNPSRPCLYIRPHNMGSRDSDWQVQYGNAAIEVCEKWGIPYVDLYKRSGMNTFIDNHRDLFTQDSYGSGSGDMTHPNSLGYQTKYLPLIESSLEQLAIEY